MITNKDRSGYFGASDTSMVIAKNRNTATWNNWWLEKLGLRRNSFTNKAMNAGTHFEHSILHAINPMMVMDKQIIIEDLKLRVNLDGWLDGTIYEVKTYKADKEFKVTAQYWRQAQVEMYAAKTKKLYIAAYPLEEGDYLNYFNKIDKRKITLIPIEYDENWINREYLPKLKELKSAMIEGRKPA